MRACTLADIFSIKLVCSSTQSAFQNIPEMSYRLQIRTLHKSIYYSIIYYQPFSIRNMTTLYPTSTNFLSLHYTGWQCNLPGIRHTHYTQAFYHRINFVNALFPVLKLIEELLLKISVEFQTADFANPAIVFSVANMRPTISP